jgi:hypothetical protein
MPSPALALTVTAVLLIASALTASAQNDEEVCKASGGKWMQVGLRQTYQCVHTYSDGGKRCGASSECSGACIASGPGTQATCQRDDNPFGCFATIEAIKAGKPVMCRD